MQAAKELRKLLLKDHKEFEPKPNLRLVMSANMHIYDIHELFKGDDKGNVAIEELWG